jgi:hypothetical protein
MRIVWFNTGTDAGPRPAREEQVAVIGLLGVATAIAVVLRVLYVVLIAGSELLSPLGPLSTDAREYENLSRSLLSGQGFAREGVPTATRPPLYPAFLALIHWATGGQDFLPVRIVQALLAAPPTFVVGWIAYRLSRSRWVGFLAAVLVALHPALIFFSGEILTEALFGALTGFIIWFIAQPTRAWGSAALCGTAIGLAALTRPTILPFAPLCLVALVVRTDGTPGYRAAVRCVVGPAVLLMAGAAVVVCPWLARNSAVFGQLTSITTNGGAVLMQGMSTKWTESIGVGHLALVDQIPEVPIGDEARADETFTSTAFAAIKAEPGRFAQLFVHKWLHFFSPLIAPQHPVLSMTIGLPLLGGVALWPFVCWRIRSREARAAFVLLLTGLLLFSLLHALYLSHIRYRLPVGEPIFIIFAADVVCTGLARLRTKVTRSLGARARAAVVSRRSGTKHFFEGYATIQAVAAELRSFGSVHHRRSR